MRIPILHVPDLKDQETLFRALYDVGCRFAGIRDVDPGWQYWRESSVTGDGKTLYAYMHVQGSMIRAINISRLRWAEGLSRDYVKVNSIGQFVRCAAQMRAKAKVEEPF